MRSETPKPASLTTAQRWLAAATGLVCTALAVLGGIGSFQAVADVAARHGFVEHPGRVPLGADLGIIALFLADLLLTWLGMPFPPLRWIAHTLVGATIWFNTAAAWGDPLGMAMHAVAPILIIAWVEGIRHATRTRARMAARRHIEAAQLGRWLLAPVATARLWRTQQLWHIASYADALALEQRRLLAIARLRKEHGLAWRWKKELILERAALRHGLGAAAATPQAGDASPRLRSRCPGLSPRRSRQCPWGRCASCPHPARSRRPPAVPGDGLGGRAGGRRGDEGRPDPRARDR